MGSWVVLVGEARQGLFGNLIPREISYRVQVPNIRGFWFENPSKVLYLAAKTPNGGHLDP